MRVIVRIASRDRVAAWGILVRHSPGVALPGNRFMVSDQAVAVLRKAGVRFKEIARDVAEPPSGRTCPVIENNGRLL